MWKEARRDWGKKKWCQIMRGIDGDVNNFERKVSIIL